MTHDNEQADKFVSFATPKKQHAFYTIMLAPYSICKKFHTAKLKKSLIIALLVNPYTFNPLHKIPILKDYNVMNYDKWI